MPVSMSAEVTDRGESPLADPVFLQELRQQMLKFASLQLGDRHLAEDAVQEALIGALKNVRSFGGRAAFKTWMYAILKNKIADTLRHRQRSGEATRLLHEDEEDDDLSELFDAKGHWDPNEKPAAWGNPEAAAHDQNFWRIFNLCLEHLPGQQGRVFMMREFIELESPEICSAVGISLSNLNVMLHRARLRLRECLENRWFAPGLTS